uniref:EF-hand domain-containing protein n=1 Tax=Heterorhabditis bacteriophora TaxID=37862 RepID=A0A1I7WMS6_HETBA
MLSREQLIDLSENFPTVSEDGSGFLPRSDVQAALKVLGIDIPGYKMREFLDRFGNDVQIELSQFASLFTELEQAKHMETNRWKDRIGSVSGAYQVQSDKQENTVHTIRVEV